MGDHKSGPPLHQSIHRLHDHCLGLASTELVGSSRMRIGASFRKAGRARCAGARRRRGACPRSPDLCLVAVGQAEMNSWALAACAAATISLAVASGRRRRCSRRCWSRTVPAPAGRWRTGCAGRPGCSRAGRRRRAVSGRPWVVEAGQQAHECGLAGARSSPRCRRACPGGLRRRCPAGPGCSPLRRRRRRRPGTATAPAARASGRASGRSMTSGASSRSAKVRSALARER